LISVTFDNFSVLIPTDNHQPESAAVLAELENIDTQADKMNIAFVKICDLELVDEFGLNRLPAIVYYRQTIPIPYEGYFIDITLIVVDIIKN
jgi:hypothetical protein